LSIAGASPPVRATSIITALENRAQLEDVQKAAGHRDPSTTKLYDRRGYNRERRFCDVRMVRRRILCVPRLK
jgi:hypothetical protein